jgi:hypothetical protein
VREYTGCKRSRTGDSLPLCTAMVAAASTRGATNLEEQELTRPPGASRVIPLFGREGIP